MTVAFVTVHRKNGFFIFNPGEGYEYVVTVAFALVALAVLGAGKISLDHALDIELHGIAVGLHRRRRRTARRGVPPDHQLAPARRWWRGRLARL